jgi:glutaredoxin-dependent peroxiredoxin
MALTVGTKAPDFTLVDTEKKLRSLREFLGKKTILAFYPGAFTGVCDKEMCTLRDSVTSLNTLNAQIVGISVDGLFANRAFAKQYQLTFPLLSDFTHEVSKNYTGLQENFAGVQGYSTSKRAIFVLDAQGVVKYAWITDNPGVEPNYDEVKKAVASF